MNKDFSNEEITIVDINRLQNEIRVSNLLATFNNLAIWSSLDDTTKKQLFRILASYVDDTVKQMSNDNVFDNNSHIKR